MKLAQESHSQGRSPPTRSSWDGTWWLGQNWPTVWRLAAGSEVGVGQKYLLYLPSATPAPEPLPSPLAPRIFKAIPPDFCALEKWHLSLPPPRPGTSLVELAFLCLPHSKAVGKCRRCVEPPGSRKPRAMVLTQEGESFELVSDVHAEIS